MLNVCNYRKGRECLSPEVCVDKIPVSQSCCGRQLDWSRARTAGQVQKVTRVESLRCLAKGKTGKTRTWPPGNSFLP